MVDLSLNDDIVLTNEFDAALQELEILFSTKNTEMLGDYEYGMNFEHFLWNFDTDNRALETYINRKLHFNTLYIRNFKYDIDVDSVQNINENIYVVKITLYKDILDEQGISTTYVIK